MATLTVDRYLDAAACTAGEAMTINSGAILTVRTDYRVHANAPASNLGSLGSVTINEGKLIWNSAAVRWMPYNTGSGNVPAIGTTITQSAVSGYLLGVWAGKTVAQTAVGAAMPTSGFIKFREVTGGAFAVGALTGIGASATSPDTMTLDETKVNWKALWFFILRMKRLCTLPQHETQFIIHERIYALIVKNIPQNDMWILNGIVTQSVGLRLNHHTHMHCKITLK